MHWWGIVENKFKDQGFRTEWIWMGRYKLFFLAWKGHQVQVYFVEPDSGIEPEKASGVKELFLELFSNLRRLETWDRVFKGREVSFRWLAFRLVPEGQGQILKEAGVEPFFFELEDGSALN
jgi:hypothetical protein